MLLSGSSFHAVPTTLHACLGQLSQLRQPVPREQPTAGAINSACGHVWDKLLQADKEDKEASVHPLKAVLCLPAVLWQLGMDERPSLSYLKRAMQAAAARSPTSEVTLDAFTGVVSRLVGELFLAQQHCQTYKVWTARLLMALLLGGVLALLFRVAAAYMLLPMLVVGPAAGILVVLDMDESAKLRSQWRHLGATQEGAAAAGTLFTRGGGSLASSGRKSLSRTSSSGSLEVNDMLESQLREMLNPSFTDMCDEDVGPLYLKLTGNELMAVEPDEKARELADEGFVKAEVNANDHSAQLMCLGHAQLSVSTMHSGSTRRSQASREAATQGLRPSTASFLNPNADPPPFTGPVYAYPELPTGNLPNGHNLSMDSGTTAPPSPGPHGPEAGQGQAAQQRSGTASPRARHRALSSLSRLASSLSTKTGVLTPPNAHQLGKGAQKAAEKARRKAAEEAQRQLGWRTGGRKAEPSGHVLHKPGAPGVTFHENVAPVDARSSTGFAATADSDDSNDDDNTAHADLSLDYAPGSSYNPALAQNTMIASVAQHKAKQSLAVGNKDPSLGHQASKPGGEISPVTAAGGGRGQSADAGNSGAIKSVPQEHQKKLAARLTRKLGKLLVKLHVGGGSGQSSFEKTTLPGDLQHNQGSGRTSWETTAGGAAPSGSRWWERALRRSIGSVTTPSSQVGGTGSSAMRSMDADDAARKHNNDLGHAHSSTNGIARVTTMTTTGGPSTAGISGTGAAVGSGGSSQGGSGWHTSGGGGGGSAGSPTPGQPASQTAVSAAKGSDRVSGASCTSGPSGGGRGAVEGAGKEHQVEVSSVSKLMHKLGKALKGKKKSA